jgi:hypothetical protein
VLGWYGVSGERYEARQVPYLASATIPGAALIVAGAVLVVGTRGGAPWGAGGARGAAAAGVNADADAELRLVMGQLYRLLVEPDGNPQGSPEGAPGSASRSASGDVSLAAPTGSAVEAAPWVTVPGGARYHRRECSLVRGKNGVRPVDAATALHRDLRPCRLCDPVEHPPVDSDG